MRADREPHEREPDPRSAGADHRLGHLTTEAFHPVTSGLDEAARRDPADALAMLFAVDEDVLRRADELPGDPVLQELTADVAEAIGAGGRLILVGCGATGRLALLLESMWRSACGRLGAVAVRDAVTGVAAGGDFALARSVEGFEDFPVLAELQLASLGVGPGDCLVAVSEGGETPFVIGAAHVGLAQGARTAFVYNNRDEELASVTRSATLLSDPRIRRWSLVTGPMALSGSTRLQATSISLIALSLVLESALRRLLARPGRDAGTALVGSVRRGWEQLAGPIRPRLAQLVDMEVEAYREGAFADYVAGDLALDVLTDTTERSPTFGIPPLGRVDDQVADPPWALLRVLPRPDSADPWTEMLGRRPACLDWTPDIVAAHAGAGLAAFMEPVLPGITERGLRGLAICGETSARRPCGFALSVLSGEESRRMQSRQVDRRSTTAPRTGALVVSDGRGVVARQSSSCVLAHLHVPQDGLLLAPAPRVIVKMALNALSTAVMARMERVIGNCMACVTPTNKKLVDRATRYVEHLSGLGEREARALLLGAIDHTAERRKAGRDHPPVVHLAVTAARAMCSMPTAEAHLGVSRRQRRRVSGGAPP